MAPRAGGGDPVPMPDAIRVLVVDDHASIRAGLLALLGREPGIEPVGGAACAAEAHEQWLSGARADVVVIDHHLPDEDGLSLCLWLKSADDPPAEAA
jgi:DNA-binding NarL/FixJ family response regulator